MFFQIIYENKILTIRNARETIAAWPNPDKPTDTIHDYSAHNVSEVRRFKEEAEQIACFVRFQLALTSRH